jgi:hypothetical protein
MRGLRVGDNRQNRQEPIRLGAAAPHTLGLVMLFTPLRGQSALTTFIALPGGARLLPVAVAALRSLLDTLPITPCRLTAGR